jgi:hypothetical protein
MDWTYNGFTVVTNPAKEFDDGEGRRKFKRSMSIELAVDALEFANQIDNIMLFSGDGDFCSLLDAVQRRGVYVTVISSLRSKPPMIADELRCQTDTFIELDDLRAAIGVERCSATRRARLVALRTRQAYASLPSKLLCTPGWLVRQALMTEMIADRPRQPLNSLTSRLNFSGFSMNMKCAPPSFSSKISVFAPLICFPIQT